MSKRLEKVKEVIKENIKNASCGLYFTRNIVGDRMTTLYSEDGIEVDICYYWSYFEVFGLTDEEKDELAKFYRDYHDYNKDIDD